jgi:hypothetical protein
MDGRASVDVDSGKTLALQVAKQISGLDRANLDIGAFNLWCLAESQCSGQRLVALRTATG